jgi:hypothetical protein
MTDDELKHVAASQGLLRLTERHMAQLAAGARANVKLVEQLPKDLHWSEESALVFRLPIPEERRR